MIYDNCVRMAIYKKANKEFLKEYCKKHYNDI